MKKVTSALLATAFVALVACEDRQEGSATSENGAQVEKIDTSMRGEDVSLSGKIEVQKVVSSLGIEAWLVEEHSIPLIAVNFGFHGGSFLDPVGKEGLSHMLAGLLDEGAGDYDSQSFQSTLDENSISLSFRALRDSFHGQTFTLKGNEDLAFELTRLAVSFPRFDEEPVERIKSQIAVSQRRNEASPRAIAADLLANELYGDHPYSQKTIGTPKSLAGLSPQDLDVYRKMYLTQDRLKVAVVGDITPDELKRVLDRIFGELPAAGEPRVVEPVAVSNAGKLIVEPFDNPQSTVLFAGRGILQDDEDFVAMFVVNHILGGGGFSARLMDEVREKRGLTYGVYTYLQSMDRAGIFAGSVASDNAKVAEAIAVTKAEIDKMRTGGVSEEELSDAKTYLTGAFALRFDSNAKIASQLLGYQIGGFPFEYINIRNDLINAVTMDDVNHVLGRFPPSSEMTFVVVGQPEGLQASE